MMIFRPLQRVNPCQRAAPGSCMRLGGATSNSLMRIHCRAWPGTSTALPACLQACSYISSGWVYFLYTAMTTQFLLLQWRGVALVARCKCGNGLWTWQHALYRRMNGPQCRKRVLSAYSLPGADSVSRWAHE